MAVRAERGARVAPAGEAVTAAWVVSAPLVLIAKSERVMEVMVETAGPGGRAGGAAREAVGARQVTAEASWFRGTK